MKNYTAQHHKKQFVLLTDTHEEVGRIVDVSNFFYFKHYIIFRSRSYDIRNVGFLKNDLELLVYKNEFDGKDYNLWLKYMFSELHKDWKPATYGNR